MKVLKCTTTCENPRKRIIIKLYARMFPAILMTFFYGILLIAMLPEIGTSRIPMLSLHTNRDQRK